MSPLWRIRHTTMMYYGKTKTALVVATIMLICQESIALPRNKRSVKRTPESSTQILGGNVLGMRERNTVKASAKSRHHERMKRSAAKRRAIKSLYGGSEQLPAGTRNLGYAKYKNVPTTVVSRFGGNVPADVVNRFDRIAYKSRNKVHQARSSNNRLASIARGRDLSPGELPPVKFGQFNYNHLIKKPSACGKDLDGDSDLANEPESSVTTPGPTPPPPPDPNIPLLSRHKDQILLKHNEYRSNIFPEAADMRVMSWDDELEWISQKFTNTCYYRDLVEPSAFHPNGSQAKRPIDLKRHSYYATEIGHAWFTWPETYDIPDDFASAALQAWNSEEQFFNHDTMECDALCEHYLQVVWAETFKIGCSMSWCDKPSINGVAWPQTLLFVCSYTPRGGLANFMAANPRYESLDPTRFIEPYRKGEPCSLCVYDPSNPDHDIDEMRSTDDKCWNKLCANDFRDKRLPFSAPAKTTEFPWIRTTTKLTTTTSTTVASVPTTSSPVETEAPVEDDVEIFVEDDSRNEPGSALDASPRIAVLFWNALIASYLFS